MAVRELGLGDREVLSCWGSMRREYGGRKVDAEFMNHQCLRRFLSSKASCVFSALDFLKIIIDFLLEYRPQLH